jgi:hypothetical protein
MAITISGSGIVEANLADNAVTLAKMASGTDGEILTYDASGNPVAVSVGTDGQVLTSTGAGSPPAFETAAGGKVLQVVSGSTSTGVQSTSSTFADTGLTATITPSATSSKILVLANINGIARHTADAGMGLRLVRGSSDILTFADKALKVGGTGYVYGEGVGCNYLDSPSTTSATTYKVTYNNDAAVGTVELHYAGPTSSTITLMEIGV